MYVGDGNVEVVGDKCPACCRRTNSGVRHQNPNIDFGAGRNNPAVRFHHMTQAFASLDALTNAVAQSFSTPLQVASRSLIDVTIDFDRATKMLIRTRERDDTVGIAFYEAIRRQYVEEQAAIVSGNALQDK